MTVLDDMNEKLDKAISEKVKKVSSNIVSSHTLSVRKLYKKSGKITAEVDIEDMIDVQIPNPEVPLGKVGRHSQMTINMGNFESVQIGVYFELPTYPEEASSCYDEVVEFVERRLNEEVAELRDYKKNKDKES